MGNRTKLNMTVLLAVVLAMGSVAVGQNIPPVADAGADQSIFIGQSALLQGSATDLNNDPIVAWLWSVESSPEGSSPYISRIDIPDPHFVGDVAGDYVLSLMAADALKWSLPDYVTIHVAELLPTEAVATADVTNGPAPLTVQFDGSQSYDPQGGALYYDWDFGDGSRGSSEVSPAHTYSVPGIFTATLTVSDTRGQSDFDSITITVTPANNPPTVSVSATPTNGYAPLDVVFAANAFDPEGAPLTFAWDFGDNGTSTGENPAHTYQSEGTYVAYLTVSDGTHDVTDSVTIVVTPGTPGGNIEVSPEVYDFGDVELGSASATIITITNPLGGTLEDPLILSDISFAAGSSADFAVTVNPAGLTVLPGESVDVGVSFTPSAEGYVSAVLQITSDDDVFSMMEVSLGGVGVYEDLPPEGQIAATLSFIDASVDAGTLAGDGSGKSAGNRLNAFENMIEACGDLIADGLDDQACDQLGAALKKCDGQPAPPDFVTGDAAEVVKSMIEVLRTTLGCE